MKIARNDAIIARNNAIIAKLMTEVKAVKKVIDLDLLNKDGTIIIETDEKDRDIEELEKIQVTVGDLRKYGRAWLIFLNRKE